MGRPVFKIEIPTNFLFDSNIAILVRKFNPRDVVTFCMAAWCHLALTSDRRTIWDEDFLDYVEDTYGVVRGKSIEIVEFCSNKDNGIFNIYPEGKKFYLESIYLNETLMARQNYRKQYYRGVKARKRKPYKKRIKVAKKDSKKQVRPIE